jgi:LysM repeat protein
MSEKNSRPVESSKVPTIALAVLVVLILGLLYAGYESITDDAADVSELTNTPLDTTGRDPQPVSIDNIATDTQSADTGFANLPAAIPTPIPTTDDRAEDVVAKPAKPETDEDEKPAKKPEPKPEKKEEKPAPTTSSASEIGGEEITYTVQAGETFYGLANRYNLKNSTLKSLNPSIQDESKDVKSGVTRIKVRVQAVHTVGPGDVLRVVAQKYGITVAQLMAANKKTKNFAERGEKLIIPFPEKK